MNNEHIVKIIANVLRGRVTGGNFAGNVYDKKFLAPALSTMQGGYRQPIIIVENIYER